MNVTADEIDAKFNAIYSLITDELGDIADKEKLMANCTAAMEKAERSMLYRGVSLERAKELDSRGLLKEKSNAQINAMADEQEKLRQNMKNLQGELDAASTQMNRIEGRCEYAKSCLLYTTSLTLDIFFFLSTGSQYRKMNGLPSFFNLSKIYSTRMLISPEGGLSLKSRLIHLLIKAAYSV